MYLENTLFALGVHTLALEFAFPQMLYEKYKSVSGSVQFSSLAQSCLTLAAP